MIQLTKSSRIAFEALGNNDKEKFMGLYRREENPEVLLNSYKAKKLPEIDDTYILKLSDQLRAIAKISEGKLIILEVVKHNTLQRIFSSLKDGGKSL